MKIPIVYVSGAIIWFATAIAAVVACKIARRSNNIVAYKIAAYRAWGSILLGTGCVLVVLDYFVKYHMGSTIGSLFFASGGILGLISVVRYRKIRYVSTEDHLYNIKREPEVSSQDENTAWPPAPKLPDDISRK